MGGHDTPDREPAHDRWPGREVSCNRCTGAIAGQPAKGRLAVDRARPADIHAWTIFRAKRLAAHPLGGRSWFDASIQRLFCANDSDL